MNRLLAGALLAMSLLAGGSVLAQGNPQLKIDPSKAKEVPVSVQLQSIENELKALKAEVAALHKENAALKDAVQTEQKRFEGLQTYVTKFRGDFDSHYHSFDFHARWAQMIDCPNGTVDSYCKGEYPGLVFFLHNTKDIPITNIGASVPLRQSTFGPAIGTSPGLKALQ